MDGGQHQQQSSALVVPHHGPPISYLPAFRLSPTEMNTHQASVSGETDKEPNSTQSLQSSLPTPERSEVPAVPDSTSTTSISAEASSSVTPPPSPPLTTQTTTQPNIVVPNIEEELSFLTDDQLNSETENSFKKPLAPNPNAEFHTTYLKFIEGKHDSSSPFNTRPIKRTTLPKITPVTESVDDKIKTEPLKEFPSDPFDDPRYYPLPKSNDKRTFESSDSEDAFHINNKDVTEIAGKNDLDSKQSSTNNAEVEEGQSIFLEDTDEDNAVQIVGDSIVKGSASNSKCNNPAKKKSKPSRWSKAVESRISKAMDSENDSDSDPAWEPTSDGGIQREKIKTRGKSINTIIDISSSTSSDESFVPSRKKRKNNGKKKINFKKKQQTKKPSMQNEVNNLDTSANSDTLAVKIVPQNKITNPKVWVPAVANEAANTQSDAKLHPLFPYKIGEFLIATCDKKFYQPPIWRVKQHNMLHRFLHYVDDGFVLYQNVPTFTAWSPGSKYVYETVDVKLVTQIKRDQTVKLLSRDLLQVTVGEHFMENSSKESRKYQDFFEIYIQALVSHVLDSKFLKVTTAENDDYYLSNIKVIDEYCDELKQLFLSNMDWPKNLITTIEKLPSYKTRVSAENCICGQKGELAIAIGGLPYDSNTFELLNVVINGMEASFCVMCMEYFVIMHKIFHFKKYTYALCKDVVKCKRSEDNTKNNSTILNEILADNDWLNKMFMDACKFWGYCILKIEEVMESCQIVE